ncbi:SMEK domain-containing protein [Epilithonimonas sp.]|uniref:SMEK domain-containing protein n=1 Tax=Epilithonimonas sp. TaxID=2894511 RepID=UPI00289F6054|nr:SMEK domain-containing protein [Epilithonimonas sp.]
MKQFEVLQSISKYLSRFKEQLKILNANGEFSINIHAENVLIKILNIVFDANFENTNYSEGKTYNTMDLRDKKQRIAIQVTATSNIKKVKETLQSFVKYNHYENFDKILILILTDRQEKYSQESFDKILESKFVFSQNDDIIDLTSLYVKINALNELTKMLAINELLESQFRDKLDVPKNPDIQSFDNLLNELTPLFLENKELFKKFGPNSGATVTEPLRTDLTLWYKIRREKLVPNNSVIYKLIESNLHYIPSEFENIFEKLKAHIYAFEKHCEDADFDYTQYQFPTEIEKIIFNESK